MLVQASQPFLATSVLVQHEITLIAPQIVKNIVLLQGFQEYITSLYDSLMGKVRFTPSNYRKSPIFNIQLRNRTA
jgi:hypothetical protein